MRPEWGCFQVKYPLRGRKGPSIIRLSCLTGLTSAKNKLFPRDATEAAVKLNDSEIYTAYPPAEDD